ncbi:glycosyltransferase [Lentzea sp. JNUCC 0626]|uniref:glycosyltransferase n=1 Tax=Lentzea sp. JNUCC 0626 TaxID=3367513 RepID=UPI003748B572
MRITLMSLGSRGDVQPFAALGTGLARRGHDVLVASAESARSFVEGAGLAFAPLTDSIGGELFELPGVAQAIRRGGSTVDVAMALPPQTEEAAVRKHASMAEACEGADVVVTAPTTYTAAFTGTKAKWVAAAWTPNTPTAAFPAWGAPSGVDNLTGYALAHQAEWDVFRGPLDRYRAAQGLPPAGTRSPLTTLGHDVPVLYPVSPVVIPPPGDWPPRCHVTGYWFWDRPSWTPDERLAAFLARPGAPVVATFGSLWPVHDQRRVLAILAEAAARVGRDLVLVGGPAQDLPDHVHQAGESDYRALFPQAAAIVHHAGCGTTAAALRAGVPQVPVPMFADNAFWARRAVELGVASAPLPLASLSVDALAAALAGVLSDGAMARRAGDISAEMADEDGVSTACDLIEELW